MSRISVEEMDDWVRHGDWRVLCERARTAVESAERAAGVSMGPGLGGGTRLMLEFHHRISHDVDLFVHDAQWIGFLTPRLNDVYGFDLSGYEEGSNALKLRFAEGEVDFIVAPTLLGLDHETYPNVPFVMEPVAEVLAKKLFYRGWSLTARDVFDWYTVETRGGGMLPVEKMGDLLKERSEQIEGSLNSLASSEHAALQWKQIRAVEDVSLDDALSHLREALRSYIESRFDQGRDFRAD